MPKYTPNPEGRPLSPAGRQLAVPSQVRPPFQLGLCLDVSDSMLHLVSSVVTGYNQLVTSMPDSEITVNFFGSNVHFLHRSVPASQVEVMLDRDYELAGATSLLDGFGDIIQAVARVYDPPSRMNKPPVLIALLTDGAENHSTRFDVEMIRQLVTYRRISCGWQFVYLGAGSKHYGLKLGIPSANIAEFSTNPEDLALLLQRLKSAVGAYYLGDKNFARYLLKERNDS